MRLLASRCTLALHAVGACCGRLFGAVSHWLSRPPPSRLRRCSRSPRSGMAPSLCAARLFFSIWVATIHASSELDELLVMATVQNDPDAVGEFLEAGVGVDAISERGVTVLMLASMMGHTEVAKHLLGRGATKEAADDLGNRALMLAASYGKLEPLNLLLDAGAEVDARNKQGLTALMLATVEGQPSAARILMDKGGATLDAADREGNQAL